MQENPKTDASASGLDQSAFLERLSSWKRHPYQPFIALCSALLLAAVLYGKFSSPEPQEPSPLPLTLAPGEAGKVGDVLVTEEALELAEISFAPVELRQVQETLDTSGRIETGGNHLAHTTSPTPGKVVRILALEGDSVQKGQVLAILESAELAQAQAHYRQAKAQVRVYRKNLERRRELAHLGEFGSRQLEGSRTRALQAAGRVEQARASAAEAKRQLAEAQNTLTVLESQVSQSEADSQAKRAHLNRAESLPEIVSLQKLERLRADSAIAHSNWESAKAKLAQGRADLEAAKKSFEVAQNLEPLAAEQLKVSQAARHREETIFSRGYAKSRELLEAESAFELAQAKLDGAEETVRLLGGQPGQGSGVSILAPISGTVQNAPLTLGESVNPEETLFTLVNLDQVWAELALTSRDLSKVQVGNRVEVQPDSSGDPVLIGHISSIAPMTDESTKTVSARAKLFNPSASLKIGTYIRAKVVTDTRLERVTVPESALQEHTGRPTLYIAKPEQKGAFEVRHVVLGEKGEGWREITEGLSGDELLATQGTFYLKSEALKASLSDGCCAIGD